MFCPSCKDEFRAGFTRCANCDVDLVNGLDEAVSESPVPGPTGAVAPITPVAARMAEYCGYFSLDEARDARDTLRREGLLADILIRTAPGSAPPDPASEEFWLRVEATQLRHVEPLLGHDQEEEIEPESVPEADTFPCPDCGHEVATAESFCPGCGLRFEGD